MRVNTPKAAAIYCRISNDPDLQALGVTRQEEDCRKRADDLGWAVAGLYVDNDVSAYSGKKRPEYERMLNDLRAGVVDAVVAWHADRLYRRVEDLTEFVKVVQSRGAAVQTVTSGDLDLTSGDGQLVATIVAATAEHESRRKSERIKRKALQSAQAGKVHGGGYRPFGFEDDGKTVREDEAELIRQACAHVLAGGTIRGLCNRWNDRGLTTTGGGRWRPQVLKRLLVSARIAGWREHEGEMVAEGEWPSIVTKGELERLRAILNDPARRTKFRSRKYLLTGGLARCGRPECGANLVSRPRDGGRRGYVCAKDHGGCGKIGSLAEPFEEAVEEMVLLALEGPDLWLAIADAARAKGPDELELLRLVAEDEFRLEELVNDHYVEGKIPKAAFLKAHEKLETRINTNRGLMTQGSGERALQVLQGHTGNLRDTWAELPFDNRRAIVAAVLDHVDVKPAVRGQSFFNPARLAPVWRY